MFCNWKDENLNYPPERASERAAAPLPPSPSHNVRRHKYIAIHERANQRAGRSGVGRGGRRTRRSSIWTPPPRHVAPAADYLWHSPMYSLTPGAARPAARPAGSRAALWPARLPRRRLPISPSPNEYACNLANITTSFSLERTIAAVLCRGVQGSQAISLAFLRNHKTESSLRILSTT